MNKDKRIKQLEEVKELKQTVSKEKIILKVIEGFNEEKRLLKKEKH